MLEDLAVVGQSVVGGQHGHEPALGDGSQDHTEMRNQRDARDRQEHAPDQHGLEGRRASRGGHHVSPGDHFVVAAAEEFLGQVEERQRDQDDEDDQSVSQGVRVDVGGHVEDLDGHHFAKFEDQRRAQVREGPDEDDDRAGEVSGQHERERDGAEQAETPRAHVAGRLFQAGVHVGQSGGDVEIHDGVEVQRLEDHHAPEPASPEPVDGRVDESRFQQEQVDRSEPGEHLLHPDGAHERRHDHGHQRESAQQALPDEIVPDQGVGHGQGDDGRQGGGDDAQFEAVQQGALLDRALQHQPEELDGELFVRVEGVQQDVQERIEQEEAEEEDQNAQNGENAGGEVREIESGTRHERMLRGIAIRVSRARRPATRRRSTGWARRDRHGVDRGDGPPA